MSKARAETKSLLARLRQDEGPLEELVALGVDALLDRSVGDLVDTA